MTMNCGKDSGACIEVKSDGKTKYVNLGTRNSMVKFISDGVYMLKYDDGDPCEAEEGVNNSAVIAMRPAWPNEVEERLVLSEKVGCTTFFMLFTRAARSYNVIMDLKLKTF